VVLILNSLASKLLYLDGGSQREVAAVASKSKRQQQLAIKHCLAQCYATDFPLTRLAQFCSKLSQLDWDSKDVQEVETTVRRLLAGVMGRERESWTEFKSA
jgi:hypothetical protein